MTEKTTDWQLVEQTGTEAAERKRWNDHFAKRSPSSRQYPIETAQGIKSKASRTRRADDVIGFLQYVALAAVIIFTLAACVGFLT